MHGSDHQAAGTPTAALGGGANEVIGGVDGVFRGTARAGCHRNGKHGHVGSFPMRPSGQQHGLAQHIVPHQGALWIP